MPNRLQSFSNLLGLHIHNSTIAEWTENNAILASKHSKLTVFGTAKSNMTGIPDGMLEPLSPTLMDIELSHTDLTSLPPDLREKWHPLSTLYIEHSLLTAFPEALLSLEVTELSLHGNLIKELPELADIHQYFFLLVMSANSLGKLIEELGEGTFFSYFSAERTLLETLPAWTYMNIIESMSLYETPYCEVNGQDTDNRIQSGAALECVTHDRQPDGRFPLQIIDPLIPL